MSSSPVVGDIDGDGDIEIVISFYNKIYAYHHDGSIVNGWPKKETVGRYTSPAIGDIDGDGNIEIIVGDSKGKIYAYHHDGSIVNGWPKEIGEEIYASPAIGDIDGDGDIEMVITTSNSKIYLYDLSGTYNQKYIEWEQLHHDIKNTRLYTKSLLPKSMINNTMTIDINGYLHMEIQKNIDGTWQAQQVIIDLQQVTIPANSYLALDTIWQENGAYTTTELGEFRVYAELRDENNNILLTDSYEFKIV